MRLPTRTRPADRDATDASPWSSSPAAGVLRLALALAVLGGVVWAVVAFETRAAAGAGDGDALCDAAVMGDADTIDRMLSRGLSPENTGRTGATPLFHAAFGGRRRAAEALLDRGAAVDAPSTPHHWTPLAAAASGGHADIVQLRHAGGAVGSETSGVAWA